MGTAFDPNILWLPCHILASARRLIQATNEFAAQAEAMDKSELHAELERLHRESYGWALSCCSRDPVEAESVLQSVYLKVLEGRARFEGKSAFKTWLFAVIRKTVADKNRRQMLRRFWLRRFEISSPSVSRAESPDERVYRSELQTLFSKALGALPKRQTEVLHLVFYHELSLAEAAQVMGISVGSARTHYERGKRKLRQRMEVTGVFYASGAERKEDLGVVQTVEAGR